jgi:F0F1-type ATP synthase membrane subunit c/vacuolar-type H+-ATPase subunit K
MATSNAATTYMEHALLQFLFKNNAESFATPGNSIYVGLATAVSSIETGSVTEATFGSYARQQVQASGWTVPSVSTDTQTATNAANIEFPASTGTNNTITHAFIADASSSGNILFVGALDASKTIATGDIFRINAGNLSIELK